MTNQKEQNEQNEHKQNEQNEYRGRNFLLLIYPDNVHQMAFFDYLRMRQLDMCYITHDKNPNLKPHIHVLVHFDTPRTCSAIHSAAGTAKFAKIFDGEKDIYVPVDNTNINEYSSDCIVVKSILGENKYSKGYPQPCKCVEDTVAYFLHKSFSAIREGKEPYDAEKMCYSGAGRTMFEKFTRGSSAFDEHVVIMKLREYFYRYRSCPAVMNALISDNRMDIITYIRKNPTFVRSFFELSFDRDDIQELHNMVLEKSGRKGGD